MKKPNVAFRSVLCCGECTFCHPTPDDKKLVGCFVEPPVFLYGDEAEPIYEQFKPVSVTRAACKEFEPAVVH